MKLLSILHLLKKAYIWKHIFAGFYLFFILISAVNIKITSIAKTQYFQILKIEKAPFSTSKFPKPPTQTIEKRILKQKKFNFLEIANVLEIENTFAFEVYVKEGKIVNKTEKKKSKTGFIHFYKNSTSWIRFE